MLIDATACYEALRARDRRFDGVFFVAVKTTGIYCRPICPARTAARDRCEFYAVAAEAERAGYRACFRCRPELAPGHAPVDARPELVRSALARIEAGYLNDHSVDELATQLGVTARHLRRTLETEIGVTPVELAQTRRLALAKQLLHDTHLPLTDVALASGFSSLRRFNAAFQERFQRPPSAVRREHGTGPVAEGIRVRLDYRPPLAWAHLLRFLAGRAIPDIESISGDIYERRIAIADASGTVRVRPDGDRLEATISYSLASKLTEVVIRLRHLLDLDARPDLIQAVLGADPVLRASVERHPGLRVPGAFDGFDVAIRTILGQRISVAAATTMCRRLVAQFGLPQASKFAALPATDIARIGIPAPRAQAIVALSQAVAEGRIVLERASDPAATMAALQELPGIGPWTAQYVAMRALRWPDAFPAGDLVLCKALGVTTAKAAEARAEAWRPWRSYAVLHLWSSA